MQITRSAPRTETTRPPHGSNSPRPTAVPAPALDEFVRSDPNPTLAALARLLDEPTSNVARSLAQVDTPAPSVDRNPPSSVLGDLIGGGEGGYGSYNRGNAGDTNGAQIDFSQLTVGEVMRRQRLPRSDPNYLFAVGKYQFVPDTLEETVNALGIDRNQRFTPELQERMFADYLIDDKRPQVNAYITGESDDLRAAQLALAQEFASVADPRTGRSFYDGVGNNSASITAAEAAEALNQMRSQFQANVQRGLPPDEAYDALRTTSGTSSPPDSGAVPDASLSRGDGGAPVRALQDRLVSFGVMSPEERSTGPGIYGPQTEARVADLQRFLGLPATGAFDEGIRAAMHSIQGGVGVERNDNATVTAALQDVLARSGHLTPGEVAAESGAFGPLTRAGLQSWQDANGVQPTGILGATTFRTLYAAEADGTSAPPPPEAPAVDDPPEPPAESASPIPRAGLSRGQTGEQVELLQDRLAGLGLMTPEEIASGPGVYGPRTEQRVQAFQRAVDLSPSGVFDNATRAAMNAIYGGVGVDRNPNPDVTRALHETLVDAGHLTRAQADAEDGRFGPPTEAALKAWQAENGVQPTGILGATTFDAIRRAAGSGSWPVPGHFTINRADKPGEGDGEFGAFRSGGRRHNGIDINAPVGSRIESFEAGEVLFAGQMRGFGRTVIVQHDDGLQTVYAHLGRIDVRAGQRVTEDTALGTIGRSGNVPPAGDAHLHFEVREGARGILTGTPVNPRDYLQFP